MEKVDMALDAAADLLDQRNDVLHGRIYAQYGQPDVRKSGRPGVPDRVITSAELYHLANMLFDTCNPLSHGAQFAIPRAIKEYLLKNNGRQNR